MAKIIQKINLEVAKPNLFQAVVAKQNDYGSRFLNVTFVNNGEKIEINPAYTATINAKRPDGTSKRFDSVINEDGTVTAPLTSWMLELTGLVTCDISVLTDEGKLTTTDFSIHVNIAACSDDDITIDEDYDILKDLIYQVETLEAEIEAKVANGEFKGEKGDKGDPGVIKFIPVNTLPEEDIDENAIYMVPTDNANEQNIYEEFIYVNGVWESLGTTQVEVDLTDYVKNTDYGSQTVAGLCKGNVTLGTYIGNGGTIVIQKATEAEIDAKTNAYKPIVPENLDYAVKVGLTTNAIELTDEEKTAAKNWLGVNGGSYENVGKTTEQNGEIFNDYENNQALGEFSSASGTKTKAGTKAFRIKSLKEDVYEGSSAIILEISGNTAGIDNNDNISIYTTKEELDSVFNNCGTVTIIKSSTEIVLSYCVPQLVPLDVTYDAYVWFPDKPELEYDCTIGEGAHAEGYSTLALAPYAHVEGSLNKALGKASHAEGKETEALHNECHAEGYQTKATQYQAHAEGRMTFASNVASHAEGTATEASGDSSHAEGYMTKASGKYSHSEGEGTKAQGADSHAEGANTQALGSSSHSEGISTIAKGNYSHTEGQSTNANGMDSHAEGYYANANGFGSHAEGGQTNANGDYSHAEGGNTVASGGYSHAEGSNTVANGDCSHAEGGNTVARGGYSHAEGCGTQAKVGCSHAGGYQTIASASAQYAIGKFNAEDTQALLVVGNGTSNTDRKNAFVVNADGSAILQTISTDPNAVVTYQQMVDYVAQALKK